MYAEMGIYNKPTHVSTLIGEHYSELEKNDFKIDLLDDISDSIQRELDEGIVKLEDWCKSPCSESVSDGK